MGILLSSKSNDQEQEYMMTMNEHTLAIREHILALRENTFAIQEHTCALYFFSDKINERNLSQNQEGIPSWKELFNPDGSFRQRQ